VNQTYFMAFRNFARKAANVLGWFRRKKQVPVIKQASAIPAEPLDISPFKKRNDMAFLNRMRWAHDQTRFLIPVEERGAVSFITFEIDEDNRVKPDSIRDGNGNPVPPKIAEPWLKKYLC
jgi:hypothetical protein